MPVVTSRRSRSVSACSSVKSSGVNERTRYGHCFCSTRLTKLSLTAPTTGSRSGNTSSIESFFPRTADQSSCGIGRRALCGDTSGNRCTVRSGVARSSPRVAWMARPGRAEAPRDDAQLVHRDNHLAKVRPGIRQSQLERWPSTYAAVGRASLLRVRDLNRLPRFDA